ncbi:MAG: hypothetical protein WKF96_15540 [Solirubrobacteraceae bacterium]
MAALLLVVAAAASLATIPLLFARWFEADSGFLALFGERDDLVFFPNAWEAFGWHDVAIVLLAGAALGCVVAVARGWFVAWAVGAAVAGTGALVCLLGRASPPDPGRGIYTTGALALDPTPAAVVAASCFAAAGLSLTGWALLVRRRGASAG